MAEPVRARAAGTLAYTLADLHAALGGEVLAKAVRMIETLPARDIVVSPDGMRITAVVPSEQQRRHDQGRKTYTPSIILSRVGGKLRVMGYCTCPIGLNCKHVGVALLTHLAGLTEDGLADDDDAEDGGDTLPVDVDAAIARLKSVAHSVAPTPVRSSPPPLPAATPAGARVPALDQSVRTWLDRIAAIDSRNAVLTPQGASRGPARRLVYVLSHLSYLSHGGVGAIMPMSVGLASDGTPKAGDVRDVDVDEGERLKAQATKYITHADFELLRDLAWERRRQNGRGPVRLGAGAACRDLLERIAATGRLHLEAVDGPVLRLGPAVAAEPAWTLLPDGKQRMAFLARDGGAPFDAVLALTPPVYVRAGAIGAITSRLPPELAHEIALSPWITRMEAPLVRAELERRRGRAQADVGVANPAGGSGAHTTEDLSALPLPTAAEAVTVRRVSPMVRLRFYSSDARVKDTFRAHAPDAIRGQVIPVALASLAFDYDGEVVAFGDRREVVEKIDDGVSTLTVMPRDTATEAAAVQRLKSGRFIPASMAPFVVQGEPGNAFWMRPAGDVGIHDMLHDLVGADRYIAFSTIEVPRLRKAGWLVEFDKGYPYEVATGDVSWWADVGEGSSIDWFSFELGISFEGQKVSIIPQLASLISKLPEKVIDLAVKPGADKQFAIELSRIELYVDLPDGRLLKVPGDRIAPILRGLLELVGPRDGRLVDGKVKLHRAEVSALAGFSDLTKVAWAAGAERLVDLGRALQRGRSLATVTPPADFKASLRPYQSEGLAWLDFLRDTGFGGVLADDMGLGKTVQGLAFLACEHAEGRLTKPALIVAPTSVLPNWQAEAARFAPHLKVLALRGVDRKALFSEIPKADLVLTTYPLLARDHEALLKQDFHAVFLDEAQAIKNSKATITKFAHQIKARHRFALTGTPLENNLGEVWSLFEFLSPGLLGDEASFKRTFRTPIEKHGDPVAQSFLSKRLKPFMLRRTKTEVAKELPPKTEIIERIQLEGAQRDLYETVRSLMEKRVREEIDRKGLAQSHIVFLDALLKLRQVCCDPRLLKMEAAKAVKQSAKLERLMELMPEMVAEGRRILLFSQFTSMLDLIEVELKRERIGYVTLRGDTLDRAAPVRDFQAGNVPVFLLSLKAGGTGLNLTAADTVIHYDPWWNPAVEAQATDRAYRIGQDKPVFVHKLIVEDGIEDAIELLKKKKAALAAALFEGGAEAPLKLTDDDIAALFAPIGGGRSRKHG